VEGSKQRMVEVKSISDSIRDFASNPIQLQVGKLFRAE